MTIVLRNSADQPIYEQICAQIKGAIISGELKAGDALPSIRGLAKDLRISVITTKRAYEELEQQGYINTLAGKGSYVAEKDSQRLREEQLLKMEEHMRAIWRMAPACGLDEAALWEMFCTIRKEELL